MRNASTLQERKLTENRSVIGKGEAVAASAGGMFTANLIVDKGWVAWLSRGDREKFEKTTITHRSKIGC